MILFFKFVLFNVVVINDMRLLKLKIGSLDWEVLIYIILFYNEIILDVKYNIFKVLYRVWIWGLLYFYWMMLF